MHFFFSSVTVKTFNFTDQLPNTCWGCRKHRIEITILKLITIIHLENLPICKTKQILTMSFEIGVSIQWISTTSAIRFVFAECIMMSMF